MQNTQDAKDESLRKTTGSHASQPSVPEAALTVAIHNLGTRSHLRESSCVSVWVAQSCPTLCDPMGCSQPGSSVHGILQARIMEWIATPFSRGSSRPRDRTRVSSIADRFFPVRATRPVLKPGQGRLHALFLYSLHIKCYYVPNTFTAPSLQNHGLSDK